MSKFPIFSKESNVFVMLSDLQKETIVEIKDKIEKGYFTLIDNPCLCGNHTPEEDIVVTEKDRYGLPFKSLICSKCGLIRTDKVFDEPSNAVFYKDYYRKMYTGETVPSQDFFDNQILNGKRYLSLIKQQICLKDIETVSEIGCGAGGILIPFQNEGKKVSGYDFNQDFLNFGNTKGLSLTCGDYAAHISDESVDLIILSHVLEHFTKPLDELKRIVTKIKPNKYLFIEVPGIFSISKYYLNPLTYYQNAHVFSFYKEQLEVLCRTLGLKIIYSDERCSLLLQKTDKIKEVKFIYDESLKNYPSKISDFIYETYSKWKYRYFSVSWVVRKLKEYAS